MTSLQIPKRTVMPCPFGGFGTDNITEIATISGGNNVNFLEGFPSAYGAPSSNNGKFVTRKEMNAIGNLASRDLFYHKCGGLNTFDPQFCAAIGGYPKGAVLQYPVANQIFEVMSLVENNTIDFTNSNSGVSGITNGSVDGINWVYCNKEIPTTGRVLLSSGDSSDISVGDFAGRIVDIVTIPANGYISGGISIGYGDSDVSGKYNALDNNVGHVGLCGGGLFAKKISNNETVKLDHKTIGEWTLLSAASQTGLLAAQYTYSTDSGNTTNVALVTLSSPMSNVTTGHPQTQLLIAKEGDIFAIATLASSLIGPQTVPYIQREIHPFLVDPGKSIKTGEYSVTLSIA